MKNEIPVIVEKFPKILYYGKDKENPIEYENKLEFNQLNDFLKENFSFLGSSRIRRVE